MYPAVGIDWVPCEHFEEPLLKITLGGGNPNLKISPKRVPAKMFRLKLGGFPFTQPEKGNVDPRLIYPCLYYGGVLVLVWIHHICRGTPPHIDKQGFFHPGST